MENVKGAVWTVDEAEFYKRRPQRLSNASLYSSASGDGHRSESPFGSEKFLGSTSGGGGSCSDVVNSVLEAAVRSSDANEDDVNNDSYKFKFR